MIRVHDMQSDAEAHGKAAPEHFAWQTRAVYVADRERELCQRAFLPLQGRLLAKPHVPLAATPEKR